MHISKEENKDLTRRRSFDIGDGPLTGSMSPDKRRALRQQIEEDVARYTGEVTVVKPGVTAIEALGKRSLRIFNPDLFKSH